MMSFGSMIWRAREFVGRHQVNIVIGGAFLIGIAMGLGFGRLIIQNSISPIIIDKNIKTTTAEEILKTINSGSFTKNVLVGGFVASVSGKNYYPADCPAAAKIKKENIIRFGSAKEAEIRGFKPSTSCAQ